MGKVQEVPKVMVQKVLILEIQGSPSEGSLVLQMACARLQQLLPYSFPAMQKGHLGMEAFDRDREGTFLEANQPEAAQVQIQQVHMVYKDVH